MTLNQAKELLLRNLPDASVRAQSIEDWAGPFPLPTKIADYYVEVGPVELEIWGYGNPWYVPSLAQLWDLQAGYLYDAKTNERDDEWRENWLVIAYEGGDPYIFDTHTGAILHDLHGQGVWSPQPLFEDVAEMISVFAVLGGLRYRAGEGLTDDDGIRPEYQRQAWSSVESILKNRDRTGAILERLGWQ